MLNKKWNEIFNLLAVSCVSIFKQLGMSGDENQLSDRIHKGLLFYSEKMLAEPGLSIKSCNRCYDDYLRRQEEQDREAEANVDEFIGAVRGSSSSGGFLGNMLSTAAGVALGNSSSNKELKKQTKLMEQQAMNEKIAAHHKQVETNYRRRQIIEENQKRRRKGLPEIPIPPGDYR